MDDVVDAATPSPLEERTDRERSGRRSWFARLLRGRGRAASLLAATLLAATLLASMLLAACATAGHYRSEPRSEGVVGGPTAEAAASALEQVLRGRPLQSAATADGALAATAAWFLAEVERRKAAPSSAETEAAAARAGFVGPIWGAVTFSLGDATNLHRGVQDLVDKIASNLVINRYGVVVDPALSHGAVVIGDVELAWDPLPRHATPGQRLRVRGEVGARFERARVFLEDDRGQVEEKASPGRPFDVTFSLARAGVHRVEVMGDGATGPTVLANVPLFVGVPESAAAEGPTAPAGSVATTPGDAATARARILALLNEARAQVGLAPLQPEPELEAVALAHSADMRRGHFVGHVSPTTGSSEARFRRARLDLPELGENVAADASAEGIHQSLMASPGHRANMLSSRYTHVGIGVDVLPGGEPQVLATLVFGRRLRPLAAAPSPAELGALVAGARRARGLPGVLASPRAQAAAEAGASVLARNPAAGPDAVFAAMSASLQRSFEVAPAGTASDACNGLVEVFELEELTTSKAVLEPRLRSLGIAAALLMDRRPARLAVAMVSEGTDCR